MSSPPLDRTGSARRLRSARWPFALARLGSLSAAGDIDALASAGSAHRPRSARWLRFQAAASPFCPGRRRPLPQLRSAGAGHETRHASCTRAESVSRDPWPWPWPRCAHRSPNFLRSLAAHDQPARRTDPRGRRAELGISSQLALVRVCTGAGCAQGQPRSRPRSRLRSGH